MLNLAEALKQIAEQYEYKLDEISTGQYRVDMSIPQRDGSIRFQFAHVWKMTDPAGRDRIYINSRSGPYNSHSNLYSLIRESAHCFYSTVTIVPERNADGSAGEAVIVQAYPLTALTTAELLHEILSEVAYIADRLEQKFYKGDQN